MKNPRIILASASPRRKSLLNQIGLTFDVVPAHCDESMTPDATPDIGVESIALRKAMYVAESHPSSLIIGSDTIVVLDNTLLGKPADKQEAKQILQRLSGQTHQVFTGVALVSTDDKNNQPRIHCFHERTDVTFGSLLESDIDAYIATGSPMDKAGSYGIQDDLGALFVKHIQGDYYNVVGFPLFRFYQEVNKFAPGFVTPFESTQHKIH